MGLVKNLLDFYFGETIRVNVLAKERDKSPLSSPATATLSLHIASGTGDVALYVFDAAPEVTLVDAPTALFTIILPAATIPLLEESKIYRYDIYTTSAAGDALHQAGGALQLQAAVEPAA